MKKQHNPQASLGMDAANTPDPTTLPLTADDLVEQCCPQCGALLPQPLRRLDAIAGQAHLRSVMTVLDVVLLGQPEVYFVTRPGLIDDNDDITDAATRQFLEGYLARFAAWIDQIAQYESKVQKVA